MTKVLQLTSRQTMDEMHSAPFRMVQFHMASKSLLSFTQNREVEMYNWQDAGRGTGFRLRQCRPMYPQNFSPLELFCDQRDGVFIACGNDRGRGLINVVTLGLEQMPVVQLPVGGKIKAACFNSTDRELIVAFSTGVLQVFALRVSTNRSTGKPTIRLPLRIAIEMKAKHNFVTELCVDEKNKLLYGASKQHIFVFDAQQGHLLGHLRTLPTGTEISTMVCDNDGGNLLALISQDRSGRWRTTVWHISEADPHNGQRSIKEQLQIDFVRPLLNIQFMHHEAETLLYIFDADMVLFVWHVHGGRMEQVTAYQFSNMLGVSVSLPAADSNHNSSAGKVSMSSPVAFRPLEASNDQLQRKVAFVLPASPTEDFKVNMIACIGQQICAFRIISSVIKDTKAALRSRVIQLTNISAQSSDEFLALCEDARVAYISSEPSASAASSTLPVIALKYDALAGKLFRGKRSTGKGPAPLCMHFDEETNKMLLGWADGRVDVRGMPSGKVSQKMYDHSASPACCITCLVLDELHETWFTVVGHEDGRLMVWKVGLNDHSVFFALPKHEAAIIALDVLKISDTNSPTRLVSVCRAGDVKIWRIEVSGVRSQDPRWKLSAYFHGGNLRSAFASVACRIPRNLVAMGFDTGLLQIWALPSNEGIVDSLKTRKLPMFEQEHHSRGILSIRAIEQMNSLRQRHGLHLALFSSARDATIIRWEILNNCLRPLQRISFSTDISQLHIVNRRGGTFELLGAVKDFVAVLGTFPVEDLFYTDAKLHLDDIEGFREQPGPVHDFHETAHIPFQPVAVCARGSLNTGTFNHSLDKDMTETSIIGGKFPTEPVILGLRKDARNDSSVNSTSSFESGAPFTNADSASVVSEQARSVLKSGKFGTIFVTQLPKVHSISRKELTLTKQCFGEQSIETREFNKKYPLIVTLSKPRSVPRPPFATEPHLAQKDDADALVGSNADDLVGSNLRRSATAPIDISSTTSGPFSRGVEATVPIKLGIDVMPMFDVPGDQNTMAPGLNSPGAERALALSRPKTSDTVGLHLSSGTISSRVDCPPSSRPGSRTALRTRFHVDQCLAVSTSLDSVGFSLPLGYSENKKKEDKNRFTINQPMRQRPRSVNYLQPSKESMPLNIIQLVSSVDGGMAIKAKMEGHDAEFWGGADVEGGQRLGGKAQGGGSQAAVGLGGGGGDSDGDDIRNDQLSRSDIAEAGVAAAPMNEEDRRVANELKALAAMTGGDVMGMKWEHLLEFAPLKDGLSRGALTEGGVKAMFLGICESLESSVSMEEYKLFTQKIRELLREKYAPAKIHRDMVDFDHESMTIFVQTNRPASVWMTVSLSDDPRTGTDVRSGANCVAARSLETKPQESLQAWLTIPNLMPETTYFLHFYGEHPLSDTDEPSCSTSQEVAKSFLEVTTDEAPPAMEIPWDSLSLAMQEVEVMAAIKDKGVRKAARDVGVALPKNDDATSLEEEASDRWNSFVDWWSDGVLDGIVSSAGNVNVIRNAFLRREMLFAASQKEIRKSAEASGIMLEDGDWNTKWLTEDSDEAKLRIRRWTFFCYWYSGVPIPKPKKKTKLKRLRMLMMKGPSSGQVEAAAPLVPVGTSSSSSPHDVATEAAPDPASNAPSTAADLAFGGKAGGIDPESHSTAAMQGAPSAEGTIVPSSITMALPTDMSPEVNARDGRLAGEIENDDDEEVHVPVVDPKARMAARTKLLKSRSKKVTNLAAKLAAMNGPSKVKKMGGKFSLKDMGKGIMAANKMAFLSKDAAKPGSTEEDLSIFEDLDEEKLLKMDEPEETKAVSRPDADYVVFWSSMQPQERTWEAMVACMDPDVMLLAITEDITPPDVEDWSEDKRGRRTTVETFEKWYGGSTVSRPRESAMMVEAALARNVERIRSAAAKDAVAYDTEPVAGDAFGRWYAQQKELRNNFLRERANWLLESRRMTVASLFFGETQLIPFQFVPALCDFPDVPELSHRIRVFPTRSAELFSAEEMVAWCTDEAFDAEDVALQTAEKHGHKAIAHDQWEQFEELQQMLEVDIMKWEDRRSDMLREVEKEVGCDFVGGAAPAEAYEFYGDFDTLKVDHLPTLVYTNGSGLENGDEITDQAEEAKHAAELAAKERAEDRRKKMEAKKKAREEERRKAEEEERRLRADRTQREREQIINYLAELKLKKIANAQERQEQEEAEAQRKRDSEDESARARAEAERIRKENVLFDIETALATKRARARKESIAQAAEREAMNQQDTESKVFEDAALVFEQTFVENASIIRSLYIPHELYFPPPQDEDVTYTTRNIPAPIPRRQMESFAVPYAQAILDDVDHNKYAFDTMSDKYVNLLGLRNVVTPARALRSSASSERILNGIRAARTYGLSDIADSTHTLMIPNARSSVGLGQNTRLSSLKQRPVSHGFEHVGSSLRKSSRPVTHESSRSIMTEGSLQATEKIAKPLTRLRLNSRYQTCLRAEPSMGVDGLAASITTTAKVRRFSKDRRLD